MGIFSRLFTRRVEMRVSTVRANVMGKEPAQLYAEQPELRAVVSYIADAIASTPLKVYVRDGENDRRRDRASTAALLLASPSERLTGYELVDALVTDLLLSGEGLWLPSPDDNRPSGWRIDPLPVSWVTSRVTSDGFTPSAYIVDNPNSDRPPVRVDAGQVVRFAAYDPRWLVNASASPVESLKLVLAERMSALEYRNAVWRNGGWVSRWISRPQGATWSPEQQSRFAASWKSHFAGKDGTDTGGTPLLEDGMELHDTTLNAREAQFAESTQLTREEVCAAYHINPSLIYHTQSQTYASAKDNARALYCEALMPIMRMVCERIDASVLPMLGAAPGTYVEFDMSSKINASFEEQARVLTSAVGGPWMTADEARARLNMPAIGGNASALVEPLNVAYGNTGEPSNALSAPEPCTKSAPVRLKTRQRADAKGSARLSRTLSKFFERQARSVLPRIDSAKARKAEGDEDWWDGDRWDRELADDLEPIFRELATAAGRQSARDVHLDPEDYDEPRTEAYIRKLAEGKAAGINATTLRQLRAALAMAGDEADESEAQGATPAGVFEKASDSRAVGAGAALAAACAVWGGMEAIRQLAPESEWTRTKTWVHVGGGETDRSEHVAMDGETVDFDGVFSNGARWPHDSAMDADENAYCCCETEITLERR